MVFRDIYTRIRGFLHGKTFKNIGLYCIKAPTGSCRKGPLSVCDCSSKENVHEFINLHTIMYEFMCPFLCDFSEALVIAVLGAVM